ncbi:hypothetical protein KQ313_05270 [Synechococcus sp. CS-1325]|uniref:hypothetical protein n=1 Tax=unclassified Synechococcus TaxID=2626047 RepID=UPI000DB82D71|nr:MULTISPECIES: hypothetical protein [unclassified Synechococcus]MCT0199085.1 hypothetical protein [Synechococcus sp. CS-1325]MCT0212551.1 hypothetical protein [Synechococcus sp. CS-1326]MCT0232067.1 hypothetical protein [Synechococcus sp. CS-1327]PZU99512.1 MAG: hypothetical protein DCF24_09180 [Cyanobium sp.]
MTPARPFALRLFMPSGQPEGMRIVEKTNWSGIGFVEELLLCCPVLGFRAFEQASGKPSASSSRLFHLKGPDASGQGFESPGGFTVLAGAKARRDFADSTMPAMEPSTWCR